MKEVIVYILIAISSGSHNNGTVETIAHFASREECNKSMVQVEGEGMISTVNAKCIEAKILIQE